MDPDGHISSHNLDREGGGMYELREETYAYAALARTMHVETRDPGDFGRGSNRREQVGRKQMSPTARAWRATQEARYTAGAAYTGSNLSTQVGFATHKATFEEVLSIPLAFVAAAVVASGAAARLDCGAAVVGAATKVLPPTAVKWIEQGVKWGGGSYLLSTVIGNWAEGKPYFDGMDPKDFILASAGGILMGPTGWLNVPAKIAVGATIAMGTSAASLGESGAQHPAQLFVDGVSGGLMALLPDSARAKVYGVVHSVLQEWVDRNLP